MIVSLLSCLSAEGLMEESIVDQKCILCQVFLIRNASDHARTSKGPRCPYMTVERLDYQMIVHHEHE